jgi:hypothetical protein
MAHTATMQERVCYLRDQAFTFRRMAEAPGNQLLRDLLTQLAEQCDDIAGNIERNLSAGIFERNVMQTPE